MQKKLMTLLCLAISFNGLGQDRILKLDSLFSQLYKEEKFTGNVLIAENGKPIFQKSYGKAFREKNLDLNSESVFELASIGKQFTAMGIMLLKKEGKLRYEDSLRFYFPELPYSNITIRHLLTHLSGMPDYMNLTEPYWKERKIINNAKMISLLAEKKPPIEFKPGERWAYSNTGYALLGSIIEKASGQSFRDFMRDRIFRPLDMRRTEVFHKRLEKRAIENYAYGYVLDKKNNKWLMADSSEEADMVYTLDGIYGDGITNSTTTDLLKWDQALYEGRLLSQEEMREAFSPAILNNGDTINYGFGWMMDRSPDFGRYLFHSGGWPGYTTWIERHPDSNKTIILLANGGAANGKITEIRNILYGLSPRPQVEIKVDTMLLKNYTGYYLFPNNDSLRIFLEAGQLKGHAGHTTLVLLPESPQLFFVKDRDFKVRFINGDGKRQPSLRILREGPYVEALKTGN
ncbi:serine hydrolase [Flavihumibacter sp.]|uniref:serine hydrolase n=1 Tax=Flavihumibacter sp. TaxID=1913981 RepID=UPI002FCABF08